MSGSPVIGLGGGAIAGIGGGIVASQLPQTGPFSATDLAIALLCGLIVWGVAYMRLQKTSR
jgi:hypothetical protein